MAEFAASGAPAAMLARQAVPEVWECHEDAVTLFLACATQWRHSCGVGGMGGMATGLDYGGLRHVAELMAVALTPDMFRQVRTLELAAIEVWADRARQRAAERDQGKDRAR